MLPTNRQRRALIRNSLVFAGFAALAVLLGVPAKAHDLRQAEFILSAAPVQAR